MSDLTKRKNTSMVLLNYLQYNRTYYMQIIEINYNVPLMLKYVKYLNCMIFLKFFTTLANNKYIWLIKTY